jgi:hypothetical protein
MRIADVKINEMGRMLADIRLDIHFIKENQKKLYEFITNPDKLDAEKYLRKIFCLTKKGEMKVTYEDAVDFEKRSKTYAKVLLHRRECPLWNKCFCLDCFGGGLTQFTRDLSDEMRQK